MNYTAMVTLGRLVTVDVLRNVDALRDGALFFQRGALQLKPDVPVCVDHDEERRVGIVRELFAHADADGEWLAALTTITDAPGWLKRGSGASVSYINLRTSALGHASRVMRGLVVEVSVLSPGVRPAEPRAQVATFHRDERATPTTTDTIISGGPILRRPNIGRVIGVR